jgi:hypothetical protein
MSLKRGQQVTLACKAACVKKLGLVSKILESPIASPC